MGKDGERKVSKDELKQSHVRAVQEENVMARQWAEVVQVFQKLEEGYVLSKAIFSVQRYGQLKDMIKAATSDDVINRMKASLRPGGQAAGVTTFVEKAKMLNQQEVSPQASGGQEKKKKKGLSGFLKKVKDFSGFSDDPVADEDVMSPSELQRDTDRKSRATEHHKAQIRKAVHKLESLKVKYEESKALAPPKRYGQLKEIIKSSRLEDKT